jgi:hypothetical protein
MVAIGGSIIRIQNRAYSVRRAVKLSRWHCHLDRSSFAVWRFRITGTVCQSGFYFSHMHATKRRATTGMCVVIQK